MAKSQSQLNKEHVARIRRKAKALDQAMYDMKLLSVLADVAMDKQVVLDGLSHILAKTEKAVQE